jgi:hypothetical protein
MLNKGFISGYGDGTFKPKETFTRAQVVTILSNIIEVYIVDPGVYDEQVGKSVCVAVPGVTLRNQRLDYLVVTPSALDGLTVFEVGYSDFCTLWQRTSIMDISTSKFDSPPMVFTVNKLNLGENRFAGGLGTEANPYLIENADQLKLLHEFVGKDFLGVCFKLTKDITLTGEWTPIGSTPGPDTEWLAFHGSFDGNGQAIKGVSIHGAIKEQNEIGLFGNVRNGGSIRNLKVSGKIDVRDNNQSETYVFTCGGIVGSLSNATMDNCSANFEINVVSDGFPVVGALVGQAARSSSITNCSSAGSIRVISNSKDEYDSATGGGLVGEIISATVTKCHSSATVSAKGGFHANAGGFVGFVVASNEKSSSLQAPSLVNNCFATGTVHASGGIFQNNAGGFSGQVKNSKIERCFATGAVALSSKGTSINVAGGFASGIYNNGVVENCYSTGSVTDVDNGFPFMIGSFTGRLEGLVKYCYATGDTSANLIVGSRRGAGGVITQCLDITNNSGDKPFFFDEPEGKDHVISVMEQYTKEGEYVKHGWDFSSVWMIPSSNNQYELPILRGDFEKEQQNLTMPLHLK